MNNQEESKEMLAVKQQMAQYAKEGFQPLIRRRSGGASGQASPWDSTLDAMMGTPQTSTLTGGNGHRGSGMFASVGSEVPVTTCGTPNLGYIEWGLGNRMPNYIGLLTSMLPYTAAGAAFNATTAEGLGAKPQYRYQYYTNGTVVTKEIDYAVAGELIQGKLLEAQATLQKYLSECKRDNIDLNTVSMIPGYGNKEADAARKVVANLEQKIKQLEEDYKTWETTNAEVEEFMENNNIDIILSHLFRDMAHYDICFPELQLAKQTDKKNAAEWKPKVIGIDYRSCHTTRLERMSRSGFINNVYISTSWQDETITADAMKVAALPTIDTKHPVRSLERRVRTSRMNGDGVNKRPTRFVMPIYTPSVGRPYYPQPAWWSIFGGEIYSYASTIISDRATRKRNSNSFGRIIYVHLDYLQKLYAEEDCKTSEDRAKVRDEVYDEIERFLGDGVNNGSTLYAHTFFANNGESVDSYRVIDLPSNSKGAVDANKTELEEAASIIFFAMQIHPDLIGAVPGRSGSSGGTYLREMHQHKQMLMAGVQKNVLKPLEVASRFNAWDTHLVWRIRQQTMTTLDRNKNGLEETNA